MTPQAATRTPGVIEASAAYTVAEFRRRTGLGDFAWRQLRSQLPIKCIGKKRFLLGADWLAFLRDMPAAPQV